MSLHPPSLPEAELATTLERESGGNPLYLGQLLQARAEGADPLSDRLSLASVIRDRISRLTEDAGRLLEAAAVLGRDFPLPVARAAVELTGEEIRRAVEELARKRILRATGHRYEFVHAVTRRILYRDLPPESRKLLHGRIFEALRSGSEGKPGGLEAAARQARHASEAGRSAEAFRLWLRAAELAERVYAAERAAAFLREAAGHAETEIHRGEVRERRADLHYRQTRFAFAAVGYRGPCGTRRPGPLTGSGSASRRWTRRCARAFWTSERWSRRWRSWLRRRIASARSSGATSSWPWPGRS